MIYINSRNKILLLLTWLDLLSKSKREFIFSGAGGSCGLKHVDVRLFCTCEEDIFVALHRNLFNFGQMSTWTLGVRPKSVSVS